MKLVMTEIEYEVMRLEQVISILRSSIPDKVMTLYYWIGVCLQYNEDRKVTHGKVAKVLAHHIKR